VLLGLHSLSMMHTNVVTDIQIIKNAGYDAIDLWCPKLERYLDAGYQPEELVPALGRLKVNNFAALVLPIADPGSRGALPQTDGQSSSTTLFDGIDKVQGTLQDIYRQCERLCAAARALKCPTLQVEVFAGDGYDEDLWPATRTNVSKAIADLADIAAGFGVHLGLENSAGTPMHDLRRVLEVIDAAGKENVGFVADSLQLWASETSWEEVAALDPRLILSVHFSDTIRNDCAPYKNVGYRDAILGEGLVPLEDMRDAIRATGYDGVWAVEIFSHKLSEWDPNLLAGEVKRRLDALMAA
jgi:sugar phosphate isomerase/epimerase